MRRIARSVLLLSLLSGVSVPAMSCSPGYDRADGVPLYDCALVSGADAETFFPFPGNVTDHSSGESASFAFDTNHLFQGNRPVFDFEGDAHLIWPVLDDERMPRDPVHSFLFRDDMNVWLVRLHRETGNEGGENAITWKRIPVEAASYRLVGPVRNQPSVPFDVMIGVDGERVFYNDVVLEGVSPDNLRLLRTSHRQGVVGDRTVILEGYGNLVVRNTASGETRMVGQDGWRHIRMTDDHGAPDRTELFDGYFHVHVEDYVYVWGDDEIMGSSTWEPVILPMGTENDP